MKIFRKIHSFLFCFMFCAYRCEQTAQLSNIDTLDVSVEIQLKFATTDVAVHLVNDAQHTKIASYHLSVPQDAFISNFSMRVGNKFYHGKIAEKKAELMKNGNGHKRKEGTYGFRVKATVPASSNVIFYITYQQILKRQSERIRYEFLFGNQRIGKYTLNLVIREPREITLSSTEPNIGLYNITLYQPQPNIAYIRLKSRIGDTIVPGVFAVEYNTQSTMDAGDLIIENGYFTHLFSPSGLKPIPKDILFVLDKSGSMKGNRIHQVKTAMDRVLDDLQENDRFTIVAFESGVEFMMRMLLSVTNVTVSASRNYIEAMKAGGGTNYQDALINGIQFLNRYNATFRSQLILFLTDGAMYSGKNAILRAIREANINDIPIFSLAFGTEADYDFVKKLSIQNNGLARRIFESDDADLHISGLYDDISVTLLKDVTFIYQSDSVDLSSLTKSYFPRYFEGSDLRVSGRLQNSSSTGLNATVKKFGSDGVMTSRVEGSDLPTLFNQSVETTGGPQQNRNTNYVQKIWAFSKVKQNLQSMHASNVTNSTRARLRQEAMDLSLKYDLLTPLTSIYIPERPDQNVSVAVDVDTDEFLYTSDESSYKPRQFGGGGDPHFIASLPGLTLPVCFDAVFPSGTALRLFEDKHQNLMINCATVTSSTRDRFGQLKTYIGEIYILYHNNNILVTSSKIIFDGKELLWTNAKIKTHNLKLKICETKVEIEIFHNCNFIVKRTVYGHHSVQYLNFEAHESNGFYKFSNGILGQLLRRETTLMKTEEVGTTTVGKLRTVMNGKHFHFIAKLVKRKDFIEQFNLKCWQVHRHTQGLMENDIEYYKVSTLLDRNYVVN